MKRFLTLLIAGIVCVNAAFPANSIEKGRKLRIVTYNVGAFGKTEESDIRTVAGMLMGVGAAIAPHISVTGTHILSLPQNNGAEPRACIITECEGFVFASTHLDHISEAARMEQLELITAYMTEKYGDTDIPVFLCGDLNAEPGSSTILLLDKNWERLSPEKATEPSGSPSACIDYISVLRNGADCDVLRSRVCRRLRYGNTKTASDHLPVLVELIVSK